MPSSRQPVGRIKHEADRGDPGQGWRRRHRLRKAAEEKADGLHEHDAEAEGDEELVLVRAGIKVADDHQLHHRSDQHDEQRAGNDGDDEGARISVGDPASIAAQHEHCAVREIEDAERAVDDRQARRDQREKGAEYNAVENLRNKIGPVDHTVVRNRIVPHFRRSRRRPRGFYAWHPRHLATVNEPGRKKRRRRFAPWTRPILDSRPSPHYRCGEGQFVVVRNSRRDGSRTRPASASTARPEQLREPPSSPLCSSCPSAPCRGR